MANPDTVEAALSRLLLTFPRFKPQQGMLGIYLEKLAKYDDQRVILGIEACIERCRYFPALAEIVGAMPAPESQNARYEGDIPPWEDVPYTADGPDWSMRLALIDGSVMDVTADDLKGPNGERGFPNAVFYASRAAAIRRFDKMGVQAPPTSRESYGGPRRLIGGKL